MSLEASLAWRSRVATHVDKLVINASALQADGRWLAAGEALMQDSEVSFDPSPWCQPSGQPCLELPDYSLRLRAELVPGRFYPRAAFGRQPDSVRDMRPTKLLAIDPDTGALRLDINHPLSEITAQLQLRNEQRPAAGLRLGELFDGPGMQNPPSDPDETYFTATAFQRQDQSSDAAFYATPRLTQHLDAHCRAAITDLYGRFLQPGMTVLDLMSSTDSHLPDTPADLSVSGLGMNETELAANGRLSERRVQDLNAHTTLPWRDGQFDCVFNTASIEYLTRPMEVLAEVRRVLRPDGLFAITFSDRWFPPKAIRLWSQLHPFERLGLITSLLLQAGFVDLQTETLRGIKRPADDKYASRREFSDPLFAVWGRKP